MSKSKWILKTLATISYGVLNTCTFKWIQLKTQRHKEDKLDCNRPQNCLESGENTDLY